MGPLGNSDKVMFKGCVPEWTEFLEHPTYDAYWADEDCSRHFDKMNVPCFTIGSWYDFMCVGSVESFIGRQHKGGKESRGQQQLLLGPWLHGRMKETNKVGELVYPENAKFPLEEHMIRWFDHFLKGAKNGVERDPVVHYYVMGAVDEKDACKGKDEVATILQRHRVSFSCRPGRARSASRNRCTVPDR